MQRPTTDGPGGGQRIIRKPRGKETRKDLTTDGYRWTQMRGITKECYENAPTDVGGYG